MIHLSQVDPRWAYIQLPPSKRTVGQVGCATTCISMLSDLFGCYSSPDLIIKNKLITYLVDGRLLWNSIHFPKFKFEKRLYGWNTNEIDLSLKDPKRAVILEVNNGSHWVVAVRKFPMSKHYFIVDSYDGKVKTTFSYKNVTGSAHFIAQ